MKAFMSFIFDEAPIRVHKDEIGNPWFVAKDVCGILDIANVSDAANSLDEDEKGIAISDTPGGPQELLTVSESGLYALIFRSRKPEAKRFRKWVTSEVLPAIRESGGFSLAMLTEEEKGAIARLAPPVQREALRAFVSIVNKHPDRAGALSKMLFELCRLFAPSGGGGGQAPVQGTLI